MDFNKEVIKESRKQPVVVDFWAPWCGPCKFLGPIIEELAGQAEGKWKLVKVNTDENVGISREYRIQGIPAVKMFFDGKLVAEFTGALPKHQIERWLDKNLPDEEKMEFENILNRIDNTGADVSILESFIKENPGFIEGKVELARRIALKDPRKASELIREIRPGNILFERVKDILAIEALIDCRHNQNETLDEKIRIGKEGIKKGNFELTLDSLIQTVMIDKEYCNQLPRKSVIAIFNLLGQTHELTKKYRKRFDMALY